MQQQNKKPADALPEQAVADYLAEHPEFFLEHPELVEALRVPHACGSALSLIEYQVRVLREQNRELRDKLHELLAVARDNDRVADRLHRLTLELMAADSLDAVTLALKDGLRSGFAADAVRLCLFHQSAAGHSDFVAAVAPQAEHLRGLLARGEPICGRLAGDQLQFLFGDSAPAIGSTALIPVREDQELGLLAIGSYQAERFHRNQGTVFLSRLGNLTARALDLHL